MTLATLLGGYVYLQEQRPDLRVWHRVELEADFRAADADTVTDIDAYRRVEERLFEQLDARVYQRISGSERRQLNRYFRGGMMDPAARDLNGNRTFELPRPDARGVALLLHGLSDSPYSMRALGELMHAHGFWVLGLRLPGHGTAPSGLLHVSWHDWAAAVRLAARDLRRRVAADVPFYLVGYSNGAALAVDYSLGVLEGEDLPPADGLVMLSPAMSVTPVAALAVWQSRLARLAGLEKLAWTEIQPEFDPYKYNSFTVNAGEQIHRLTQDLARRLDRLANGMGTRDFPRVLAFQSVVDATVPPTALLDNLFLKLTGDAHALVLFDVNRNTHSEPLLRSDPETLTQRLFADRALPFDLTLVTNAHIATDRVVARVKRAGEASPLDEPLELSWPSGVFSLSHVALPFPPHDPLYGARAPGEGTAGANLGSVAIRGERNLLQIPDSFFLRLRHNPFFAYMAERVVGFLGPPARRAPGD
ncbi:MAG: alpha/beta hydrolase [Gammaproteobacteria bacterium]|nr:alpha/beta hydrolase [Gammaproteobacteria bacterium]